MVQGLPALATQRRRRQPQVYRYALNDQPILVPTANGSSVESDEPFGFTGLKPPRDFCRHVLVITGRRGFRPGGIRSGAIAIGIIRFDEFDIGLVIAQEAFPIVTLVRKRGELEEFFAETLAGRPNVEREEMFLDRLRFGLD